MANKNPYFYGVHAVLALLTHRPLDVKTIFIQKNDSNHTISATISSIVALADTYGISVQYASKDTLNKLSASQSHQGVVAMATLPTTADEGILDALCQKQDALFLVLDQITDSHNLGACLRTACAMKVDAVIIPKNQSATITPAVAKVSVGASEIIPVVSVTNLARTLTYLKSQGVFVFGTALDDSAKPAHLCDFVGKVAIVMGSEGEGMRRLTGELCDTRVYIPIDSRMQSLNVSVATGMMLYEVQRQRAV